MKMLGCSSAALPILYNEIGDVHLKGMPVNASDYATVFISTVATFVAACAAAISYAVYRTQADPDVVVYAETDSLRPTIINLVIKNIGRAPAYDVRFTSSTQLPAEAFGLNPGECPDCKIMTDGPLVTGIPFLPPDSKRVITWGQFGGLYRALGDDVVSVCAIYKSRHFGIPRKIRIEQTSAVEIRSFKGTDGSNKNYEKQIADNIKELSKGVGQIAKKIG